MLLACIRFLTHLEIVLDVTGLCDFTQPMNSGFASQSVARKSAVRRSQKARVVTGQIASHSLKEKYVTSLGGPDLQVFDSPVIWKRTPCDSSPEGVNQMPCLR